MNRTWLVILLCAVACVGIRGAALEPTPQEHEYARRLVSLSAEASRPHVATELSEPMRIEIEEAPGSVLMLYRAR